MGNSSTDNDALRALLERLFPDVDISDTAVDLLAAQIAQLDGHHLFRHASNHFQPNNNFGPHFEISQTPNRLIQYGANHYPE
jgi:hypothetical protein